MPLLKLTDKSIAKLPAPDPSGQQTFYWDENQTGFGILVSGKTKVKSYIAKGQLGGKGVLKTLGRVGVLTQAEARQAARELFRDLGAGVHPHHKKVSSLTLGETLAMYLESNDLGPRTKISYSDLVARYFGGWVDTKLRDISREMVEARHLSIASEVEAKHRKLAEQHVSLHLDRVRKTERAWPEAAAAHRAKAERAKQRKPFSGRASANGAMRVLRAVYNYALDKTADLPPNPVRLKRQWNKIKPRERIVSNDDMAKFYDAVSRLPSPIGRDYLLLVMFTGLRRREASALRWSDVDFKAKTLSIPADRNKAGRKLDLPLTDYVHDLLVARRAIGRTEFVFHADSKSGHMEMPNHHLALVADTCGVKVSVHDLRRTFMTVAESCDISPMALKALVNHSQGKDVTSGYVQIVVERLREPAQRVTDRLKQLAQVSEPVGTVRLRG